MIHPEIYSPNDILSLGPTSFLVTNDHLTQKHGWRTLEEVFNLRWTSWTNVVRVDLTSTGEVQVETVLAKEHNANGLAWGPDGEIMLVDTSGGVISRLSALPSGKLSVIDRVQLDTTLDNPSYYHDNFATPQRNASAYILPGLTRGIDLDKTCRDPHGVNPWVVWTVKRIKSGGWEKKVLVEDDGGWMRSASSAVIVGIDPEGNGGRKQGWDLIAGFLGEGVGVIKLDL